MRTRHVSFHFFAVMLAAISAGAAWSGDAAAQPAFDVPRLANINIDGSADDWGTGGFQVGILADAAGKVPPASDFRAGFRLGWNDEGLLVLAHVSDDTPLEPTQKPEELWKGDSIEFFAATKPGSDDSYQVVVSPGIAPDNTEARENISDYRKTEDVKKGNKLSIKKSRAKAEKGYVMEVLLPWKNLSIEAAEGKEVGFQFYANDSDKADDRKQLLWFPVPEANKDSSRMYLLRLADKASSPVQAVAFGSLEKDGAAKIGVIGVPELKGKSVTLKDGDKVLHTSSLREQGETSGVRLELQGTKDKPFGPITVLVGEQVLTVLKLSEAK